MNNPKGNKPEEKKLQLEVTQREARYILYNRAIRKHYIRALAFLMVSALVAMVATARIESPLVGIPVLVAILAPSIGLLIFLENKATQQAHREVEALVGG